MSQYEQRCGRCDQISIISYNNNGWGINGCLTFFKDGMKSYLRGCCYDAYFNGTHCWDQSVKSALEKKHSRPHQTKVLLLEGKSSLVYELKKEVNEESIKTTRQPSLKIQRSVAFNEFQQSYEILTNGEYKKRTENEEKKKHLAQSPDQSQVTGGRVKYNYVYLLMDKAEVKTNKSIYKIGKTSRRNFARFKDYPKGKNKGLNRNTNDLKHFQFRQRLLYKALSRGKIVEVVKAHNTTKTCSNCGSMKKMTLSDREYVCNSCNQVLDRDFNAAKNMILKGLLM